jgi:hypothetical protein
MLVHFIARVATRRFALLQGDSPFWLWPRLAACLPDALGALLMPDHLHIIADVDDPEVARAALARTLGWHGRRFVGAGLAWETPPPRPVAHTAELRRQLRELARTPCRAGLADDPLSWAWSTHRDILGAVAKPWVDPRALRDQLRDRRPGFSNRWHRYVSANPSVDPVGSAPPRPELPASVPTRSLADIWLAATVASRRRPVDVNRRGPARHLFVLLADHQGWRSPRHLCRCCSASPGTIQRLQAIPRPAGLAAASLCLGDERILRPSSLHRATVRTG